MRYVLFFLCGVICSALKGQGNFAPRNLQVTVNKTTNLIFPSSIASIDRGSEHIIVQKSLNNILKVKADTSFTDTTNLSVITTDGKLYSFLVSYHASPELLNMDLGAGEVVTRDTALWNIASNANASRNNLYGLNYSIGQVQLSIVGIYAKEDKLVCKLRIENNSSFTYEVDKFRFYISAKNAGKRKAIQESEITSLLIQPGAALVRERQSVLIAVVLPKIAVGSGKVLRITLYEKNGERHLILKLPSKFILNAPIIH